ncbi:hypothetical protein GIB67_033581 [Kingdonia uniflora]|uniref:Uncharacterized protein n=1 Tax=Kingdonia uniflora TaxID=39325 RepID=A0A7J7L2F1_9MAGN|nr:hypothetical protein GIB67_033581 [Kingdonia uniflora]
MRELSTIWYQGRQVAWCANVAQEFSCHSVDIVFAVFYGRIWTQRNDDGRWSGRASQRLVNILEVAGVYVFPETFGLNFVYYSMDSESYKAKRIKESFMG